MNRESGTEGEPVLSSKTLSVATIAALSLTGVGASSAVAAPGGQGSDRSVVKSSDRQADKAKKIYKRILKRLPKDYRAQQEASFARLGVERQPQQRIAKRRIQKVGKAALSGARAIDPSAYECGPTAFNTWLNEELADVDPTTLTFLEDMGALDVATYDALLFGAPDSGDHDLSPDHSDVLTSSFSTIQNFWDVNLDDIELLAMDRDIFSKTTHMARALKVMYEISDADATALAKDIQNLVANEPALNGGDHPIFTLNAVAFSADGAGGVSDRVAFGDGLLESMDAIGHGDVAPEAVMSHEMAHHVQFENNVQAPSTPEGTRSKELGADAFGSYSAAHPKGLNESPEALMGYQAVAYDIGDCNFESSSHHGTPNQRKASAAWGAAQYENQADPNAIEPSLSLQAKFVAALPTLTAPDAATNIRSYLIKGDKAA